MVREFKLSMAVPGCTAEEFFEMVFHSSEFKIRSHKDLDGDSRADVGPWENGVRTVHYSVGVELPSAIRAVIGADVLPMREVQTIVEVSNGVWVVDCMPFLDLPIGRLFCTIARFSIMNCPSDGYPTCVVDVTVTCTAAGPYGFISTIEGLMVGKGREALKKYLDYTLKVISQGGAAVSPALSGPDEGLESFYDALESASIAASAGVSEMGGNFRLDPETARAICAKLDALQCRIHALAADVADVRMLVMEQAGSAPPAKLQPPSYIPYLLGFGIAFTGLVAIYAARRRT